MSDDGRARLAEQQAALVRSLVRKVDSPPAGFDVDRVGVASNLLLAKRRRTVARGWPAVVKHLGTEFEASFADFARENPLSTDDSRDDGRAFLSYLLRSPGIRLGLKATLTILLVRRRISQIVAKIYPVGRK